MRRWLQRCAVVAAVVLALVGIQAGGLVSTATARDFVQEPNIDRSGNDFRVEVLASNANADDCDRLCRADKVCVAYTFVKRSSTVPQPLCRLKDAAPHGHESSCCTSGSLKR